MRKIWNWIAWLFTGKTYGKGIVKILQDTKFEKTHLYDEITQEIFREMITHSYEKLANGYEQENRQG